MVEVQLRDAHQISDGRNSNSVTSILLGLSLYNEFAFFYYNAAVLRASQKPFSH
jgi:hypothetical protein